MTEKISASPMGELLMELDRIASDENETPRRRRLARTAWTNATLGGGSPSSPWEPKPHSQRGADHSLYNDIEYGSAD